MVYLIIVNESSIKVECHQVLHSMYHRLFGAERPVHPMIPKVHLDLVEFESSLNELWTLNNDHSGSNHSNDSDVF